MLEPGNNAPSAGFSRAVAAHTSYSGLLTQPEALDVARQHLWLLTTQTPECPVAELVSVLMPALDARQRGRVEQLINDADVVLRRDERARDLDAGPVPAQPALFAALRFGALIRMCLDTLPAVSSIPATASTFAGCPAGP